MNIRILLFSALMCVFAFSVNAQCGSTNAQNGNVKASIQYKDDIVDVAASLPDFSTLVAAVKAAGLVEILKGEGPFTVFAPTNSAFAKLPKGTVESLLVPSAKDQLTKILTYHVVAGEVKAADVLKAIKAGGGSFTVETVSGGKLIAKVLDGSVVLEDENGGMSTVTQTDVAASNGVIHVVDTVVLPK